MTALDVFGNRRIVGTVGELSIGDDGLLTIGEGFKAEAGEAPERVADTGGVIRLQCLGSIILEMQML